jgi:dipeptidyl aminopeptidase/acylaminoacyl peptidase
VTRKPWQPEDLRRLKLPNNPQLSPDGTQIAYVLTTVGERDDGYRSSIRLLSTVGGPDRELVGGDASAPSWSHDGASLAFLRTVPASSGRPDTVHLHVIDMRNGSERQITTFPLGVSDLAWSPDGDSVVVVFRERTGHKADAGGRTTGDPPDSVVRHITDLGYQADGAGFTYEYSSHLALVDIATGAVQRLTANDRCLNSHPSWSADGKVIAFTKAVPGAPPASQRSVDDEH